MIVADQLHMDPDEFRSVLKSKITSYNNAIERLRAEKPVVDPNAFELAPESWTGLTLGG